MICLLLYLGVPCQSLLQWRLTFFYLRTDLPCQKSGRPEMVIDTAFHEKVAVGTSDVTSLINNHKVPYRRWALVKNEIKTWNS